MRYRLYYPKGQALNIMCRMEFNAENFECIYDAEVPKEIWYNKKFSDTLAWVFEEHNVVDRPNRLTMRSFSVGDVVVLYAEHGDGGVREFMCKALGWAELHVLLTF